MSQATGLVHVGVAARAGEPPHPLLLLLHGRGADEYDLLGLGPELDPRFFVVSARAPYAWGGGGYAWYELDAPGRANQSMFSQSLELLRGFVQDLATSYPIDATRRYLLGFSQGAMMSNALTLTAPELVSGAVLLSGFQPALDGLATNPDGVRRKPIFVAHGTHDPIIGIEMGRAVRDTLTGVGADLTYREYPMGHQIIGPELDEIRAWLGAQLA